MLEPILGSRTSFRFVSAILLGLFMIPSLSANSAGETSSAQPWVGFHCFAPQRKDLAKMVRLVDELARLGVNTLVLQVDYRFQFESHPKIGGEVWFNKDDARQLAAHCQSKGMRLIPQMSCVGHQSGGPGEPPYGLLREFPQFDETPDRAPDSPGFYCREWCVSEPAVYPVVNALMDEVIDAFGSEYFHVGMDEVFLIGDKDCPRCKGAEKAALFAGAVNTLHQHLVEKRGLQMLMWGDRLIDGRAMKHGSWEGSANDTFGAIDLIPKDIIICDWHYEVRESYPSVPMFMEKGFRVWPSTWRNREATIAFIRDANTAAAGSASPERLLGTLFTTWVYPDIFGILHGGGDPALDHPYYQEAIVAMQHGIRAMGVPTVPMPPLIEAASFGVADEPVEVRLVPAGSDAAEVRFTLDGSDVTEDSQPYSEPLGITEPVIIQTRSFNTRGGSLLAWREIKKVEYLPAVEPTNPEPGLLCHVYAGAFSTVGEMNHRRASGTVEVEGIDLSPAPAPNGFGFEFIGYLRVEKDGVYTFWLGSDDGAVLILDGKVAVDNDGKHQARWREAPIALRSGFHELRLLYFDAAGEKSLELEWKAPGGERVAVPRSALFRAKRFRPPERITFRPGAESVVR